MSIDLLQKAKEFEQQAHYEEALCIWLKLARDSTVDPSIRLMSTLALFRRNYLAEATEVIQVLFNDPALSLEDQIKAIYALGHHVNKLHAADLLQKITRDPSINVSIRWDAASSLWRLLLPGTPDSRARARGLNAKLLTPDGTWQVTGGRRTHQLITSLNDDGQTMSYRCDCEGHSHAVDQMCSHALAVLYALELPKQKDEYEEADIEQLVACAMPRLGRSTETGLYARLLKMAETIQRQPPDMLLAVVRDNTTTPEVRHIVITTLKQLNRLDELLNLARSQRLGCEVRWPILRSLIGHFEPEEFITLTLSIFKRASDATAHRIAMDALQINDPTQASMRITLESEQQPEMAEQTPTTSTQALEIVGRSHETVTQLSALARNWNTTPKVRLVIACMFVQMGYRSDARDILLDIAQHIGGQHQATLRVAVEALIYLRETEALLAVARNVEAEPRTRQVAIDFLARMEKFQQIIQLANCQGSGHR